VVARSTSKRGPAFLSWTAPAIAANYLIGSASLLRMRFIVPVNRRRTIPSRRISIKERRVPPLGKKLFALLIAVLCAMPVAAADRSTKTKNVVWVMMDGVRWQEVFRGADASLINKDRGGVTQTDELRKRFVRDSEEASREALLPFLWQVVAKQGQLLGNHARQSAGRVTNRLNFSYPGYSEVLCGFADDRIDSNDKNLNPNRTVLEWLHAKPEFRGKVAAVTSWDVFPFIINAPRSGIPVSGGGAPLNGLQETPEVELLNRLSAETPLFDDSTRPDAITFHAARVYIQQKQPRVFFLSFDETDTQAHYGRYDRVLASAHKADAYIRELWEMLQEIPQYQGKTTLIITTDHGRGDPPVEWKNHGENIAGSEYIWLGVLGPDTPPLGERGDINFTQNQIAATAAAALGYDYNAAVAKAAKPVPGVVRSE
jgi:hypothetical protein